MSPPSNEPTAPAPIAPNTARRRSSTRAHHPPQERIDSILEAARVRRVAMGSASDNEPLARAGLHREEIESSADEETSIVRRSSRQSMNYQTTVKNRAQQGTNSLRQSGHTSRVEEEENEEAGGAEHESWWARLLSKYGSIELENKGSVARDHLALERTFLAWLRTSLAFASIGIAVTQLFRLNTTSAQAGGGDPYRHLRQMGKPLGATFLGLSIMILFVGFHRYFEGQHWIIRGKFPASRGSIVLVAAITFALMITSLVVVIVVEPGSFEK